MAHERPIKYGDVFLVSEEIAMKPIAPQDAAAMQSAETQILGYAQRGGPAAVMQSAANKNVQAGLIAPASASDVGRDQGMTVTQTIIDGRRFITESVANQVVARYADPNVETMANVDTDAVTMGEALEKSAISAGDKPIDQSDAAAIQAAEMRAIGANQIPPGGLGAEAQSVAIRNARLMRDDQKTTIGDVLGDATTRLAEDKVANLEDAEKVVAAEMRNNLKMVTNVGGVAESVAAAARVNQQDYYQD